MQQLLFNMPHVTAISETAAEISPATPLPARPAQLPTQLPAHRNPIPDGTVDTYATTPSSRPSLQCHRFFGPQRSSHQFCADFHLRRHRRALALLILARSCCYLVCASSREVLCALYPCSVI
ncbi:unnamed protein product [Amoebophrya sp. A120]|nr:unnamed protein product [Amoebophrya sp. A120]|eukprot:GSA120T00006037001.1